MINSSWHHCMSGTYLVKAADINRRRNGLACLYNAGSLLPKLIFIYQSISKTARLLSSPGKMRPALSKYKAQLSANRRPDIIW